MDPIVRSEVIEKFVARCLRVINEYEREEDGNPVDDEGRTVRTIRMVLIFHV